MKYRDELGSQSFVQCRVIEFVWHSLRQGQHAADFPDDHAGVFLPGAGREAFDQASAQILAPEAHVANFAVADPSVVSHARVGVDDQLAQPRANAHLAQAGQYPRGVYLPHAAQLIGVRQVLQQVDDPLGGRSGHVILHAGVAETSEVVDSALGGGEDGLGRFARGDSLHPILHAGVDFLLRGRIAQRRRIGRHDRNQQPKHHDTGNACTSQILCAHRTGPLH